MKSVTKQLIRLNKKQKSVLNSHGIQTAMIRSVHSVRADLSVAWVEIMTEHGLCPVMGMSPEPDLMLIS